jgi:cbb3-type cytochrome oxidase subunit 3
MISGLFIALMLVLFVGLFVWAYAPSRKQRFSEAAALALVDDVTEESAARLPHPPLAGRERPPLSRCAGEGSRSACGRENHP